MKRILLRATLLAALAFGVAPAPARADSECYNGLCGTPNPLVGECAGGLCGTPNAQGGSFWDDLLRWLGLD